MDDTVTAGDATANLTGTQASAAVNHLGWRFLLGTIQTAVPVTSLSAAVEVAAHATEAAGSQADGCLRLDLGPDRVTLTLMSRASAGTTRREIQLAQRLTTVIEQLGLATVPATNDGPPRSLQTLEVAIDALDIPAIRPFWKMVLAYADEPGRDGPTDPVVDPLHHGPRHLVPADGADQTAAQPNPRRPLRAPRRSTAPPAPCSRRWRDAGVRPTSPGLLDPRRRRGQRGLHHHLAGSRLSLRREVHLRLPSWLALAAP